MADNAALATLLQAHQARMAEELGDGPSPGEEGGFYRDIIDDYAAVRAIAARCGANEVAIAPLVSAARIEVALMFVMGGVGPDAGMPDEPVAGFGAGLRGYEGIEKVEGGYVIKMRDGNVELGLEEVRELYSGLTAILE